MRPRVSPLLLVLALSTLLSGPMMARRGAAAQSGGPYGLTWSTVDSGGYTVSSGGPFTLGGTIGQADPGLMVGGEYTLGGGFWGGGPRQSGPEHRIFLPLVLANAGPAHADTIFHNGTVLTMEGETWNAEAIVLRSDRILAVGGEAEVLSTQGPETHKIDLGGRSLMPSFVDAHTHILSFPWE